MDWMQYVERLGLPVVFCGWLMFYVMRELREMKALQHKQVVLLAVISRTLDVEVAGAEPAGEG